MAERKLQGRYKDASRDLLEARVRLEKVEEESVSLSSSSRASFREGVSFFS